jgi:hypothetical protein
MRGLLETLQAIDQITKSRPFAENELG